MNAFAATPFERLHWTAQDIADAVPPPLHQIDLFDAAALQAAANATPAPRTPRLRNAYLASVALPARFCIR